MKLSETKLPGVVILEPEFFRDSRGGFMEFYHSSKYQQLGIDYKFVQDNYSLSKKNVLRGLHFQKNSPQGKLVTCLTGCVYDVVADINVNSNTFGQYIAIELSEKNKKQVFIPPGYAHGFFVMSEIAAFFYKCTSLYDHNDESGVLWNDETLNIDWPSESPILSAKDQKLPKLSQFYQ